MILVEAAVETFESALAAERSGADRIELCANLSEGGTTPSAELIAAVAERVRIPVFVLIRPRGGDFVYADDEVKGMIRDIALTASIGVGGIVTGALTSRRRVEVSQTRALMKAAAGLPVTFHRAFDFTENQADALEQVITLGAKRILTSGGAATALEGTDAISALVHRARGRIAIIAGGGVREQNVRDVIARTGVREVHARFLDEAHMRGLVEVVKTD